MVLRTLLLLVTLAVAALALAAGSPSLTIPGL
jgi:hypothetical protein